MSKNTEKKNRKPWPKDCIWPEPVTDGGGTYWEADLIDEDSLDEEGRDLMEIKAYFDSLVEEGRLNEDYTLNEDYEDYWTDDDGAEDAEDFVPELGEEYWEERFHLDVWEEDLADHMNRLKLDCGLPDPAMEIHQVIGYTFVNENLLRQAFTRRSFAVEHGLSGCNEELEFLGDSVLNLVVTREIVKHLTETVPETMEAPFSTKYNEGDLTKIRSGFISKEYLAERASALGLDGYILYGTSDAQAESSREDVIEALIGAVTIDSGWDWPSIETVIDRLLCLQLTDPDRYLKKTYYELFNAWHQSHFGHIPSYEVYRNYYGEYECTMRFQIPSNDQGLWEAQRVDISGSTRSRARELAAELAYWFVVDKGLWVNLKDAGITPDQENSINQLQELYQKNYVEELPEYEFSEYPSTGWDCKCTCSGITGWGQAPSKIKAKKAAAFMVLERLFRSTGM